MGMLLSTLWQKMFDTQTEMKIVLVGLAGSGKSTILYKLILDEAVVTAPTLGANVEEYDYKNIHFSMWDLGGQDQLRATWETYYEGSNAIILVIDSTDADRMDLVREELFKILAAEDLAGAAILILANKQDLDDALSVADISTGLNLTSIRSHAYHIQACCALTGEGLFDGLDWIVDRCTAAEDD